MYEAMSEVYKLVIPIHESRRAFDKLEKLHGKLQTGYQRIVARGDKRLLGSFFRVGFYGSLFNDLDKMEFVYKEEGHTRLAEFSLRLEVGVAHTALCGVVYVAVVLMPPSTPPSHVPHPTLTPPSPHPHTSHPTPPSHLTHPHPSLLQRQYMNRVGENNVVIIKDSNPVSADKLDPTKAYIQITYVEPYFADYEMNDRVTSYDRTVNVREFTNHTPYMCACGYVHVCMWVCGYVHVCVYACTCVHVGMYTCACGYVHVCVYACTCVHVGMYTCACGYVHMCVCACMYMCVCTCVCEYMCVAGLYSHVPPSFTHVCRPICLPNAFHRSRQGSWFP